MTAEIHLFTGIVRTRPTPPREFHKGRHGAPLPQNGGIAPAKSFHPGQKVFIANYDWDLGETKIHAEVIKQDGEWVAVRAGDHGSWSVHVSVLHARDPEAA